jgi:hypothetical protein
VRRRATPSGVADTPRTTRDVTPVDVADLVADPRRATVTFVDGDRPRPRTARGRSLALRHRCACARRPRGRPAARRRRLVVRAPRRLRPWRSAPRRRRLVHRRAAARPRVERWEPPPSTRLTPGGQSMDAVLDSSASRSGVRPRPGFGQRPLYVTVGARPALNASHEHVVRRHPLSSRDPREG